MTELLLPATILPCEGISRIASYTLRGNMLENGVFWDAFPFTVSQSWGILYNTLSVPEVG
jgi:hypothetical protein